MPTEAELKEEFKELQDKVIAFKKEYEVVFEKLRILRQDMARETKKTVDDLDSRIPQLREQIADKEKVLAKVNADIDNAQAMLEAKKDVLDEQYRELENQLQRAYNEKLAQLDIEIKTCQTEKDSYAEKLFNLEEREKLVKKEVEENAQSANTLEGIRVKLLKDKSDFSDFIHATTDELKKENKEIDDALASAKLKLEQAEATKVEAESYKDKVNGILARIAEAEDKEQKAKLASSEALKERERANEAIVKCRVEQKALIKREKEVEKRENDVTVREGNVKKLESDLAGGGVDGST